MKVKDYLIFLLITVVVSFFITGCRLPDTKIADDNSVPFDAQQSFDPATSNKLAALVKANDGEEVLLNLADDDQYAFVQARVNSGGKNRQNSPRLFKALEETRKKHLAAYGRDATLGEPEEGNKHTLVKIELSDQERLTVTACGSALEGTTYIYLDCIAADKDWKHLTTYQYNEAFSAERVDVTSDGNIAQYVDHKKSRAGRPPQLVIEYLQVDSLLIYQDANGNYIVSYYYSATGPGIIYPVGMMIADPKERAAIHDDDNIVKICLGRNHGDCDYEVDTPQQAASEKHLRMPFKGYVDFGLPIQIGDGGYVSDKAVDETGEVIRNLDLALCLTSNGGMITKRKTANENLFWHHPNTIVTTGKDRYGNSLEYSRLQWDMSGWASAVDFGQTAFQHCEVVDFFVQITVPLRDTVMAQKGMALPGKAFIVPENYFDNTPYFFKPVITDMNVTEGSHFVSVIGKNNTGQWQGTLYATSYEWTVDTTPPQPATLYNKPLVKTRSKQFAMYVDGTDIESYCYQLDANIDGTFNPGSKSNPIDKAVAISKDMTSRVFNKGYFILSVWGIDKAGNQQETATTYAWTIEPPNDDIVEARLLNVPPFFYDQNSIEIVVSGMDIYYYKYNLDNTGFTNTLEFGEDGDRITSSGLADGFHTLEVLGSSNGIEWQTAPVVINWHVDTSTPVAEYNMAISQYDKVTPATDFYLEVTGDDIIAYEYCLDRGDSIVQDIRTLIYEDNLSPGLHSLTIRGKDRAGNWQPQSQATPVTWVVDPDANSIALRNVPRTVTNDTRVNIQLQNDLMASFKYALDSSILGDELPIKDFMKMPKIQFAYSCLARNTMITMADGSLKMIPDVKIGEKVTAYSLNAAGNWERTILPVFDLVRGTEVIPMYRIIDDTGNSLLCTQGHPIMLADGTLKLAKDLNPGERMMTESGSARIIVVATEMYNDTIFNLVLGEASRRSAWINSGYVMVGNGILIGDNTTQTMQQNLAYRNNPYILSSLPHEWYTDFFFSMMKKCEAAL